MAYLEIQSSDEQRRVELDTERTTIGRHPSNHVCLDTDVQVSRFHCEIVLNDDGEFLLRDLESRNGTVVIASDGEQRVTEFKIPAGTWFRVGSTHMRLVGDTADEADADADADASEQADEEAEVKSRRRKGRFRGGRTGRVSRSKQSAAAGDDPDPAVANDNAAPTESATATATDAPTPTSTPAGRSHQRADFAAGSIEGLAEVGDDVGFGEHQIALINARGEMVHEAGDPEQTQKQETAETVHLVRLVLLACMRSAASDVHVEPREGGGAVRLRVDGTMVQACLIDEQQARRMLSLVKILSDLDITNRTGVQEGHFAAEAPDRRVDYRVSFTPSMYGQKLVLRVLDPISAPQHLDDLKLPAPALRRLRRLASQDTGMMLAAGPTGSGKTTTLYAMLREIDAHQRNVITIEDPIEYALPGATQIPVDEDEGHTFQSLLKSVLRQDPDVILVGEIRDKETATIAMRAATTGHMVLSSIHAQDAVSTVFRLLDLGVEPYLIGSTLNIVVAQRLARVLCEHCKQQREPSEEQRAELAEAGEELEKLWAPVGCQRCFGTGYHGRRSVCELMNNTRDVRDVILASPSAKELREALMQTEFTPLREVGLELVREGITSLEEIDRVIGE